MCICMAQPSLSPLRTRESLNTVTQSRAELCACTVRARNGSSSYNKWSFAGQNVWSWPKGMKFVM